MPHLMHLVFTEEGSRLWHQGEDPGFGSGMLSGFVSPHGELVPSVCRAASSLDLLRREHSTASSAAVRQPRGMFVRCVRASSSNGLLSLRFEVDAVRRPAFCFVMSPVISQVLL